MELRVLRYFLGVARKGSITGAAQALHVTQPTLSRQLKDLEDELGQQLFIRGSHSVSLTPEGMLLRKRAGEIMEMVYKTEAEFNSMGDAVCGDVYIGGGETDAMRQIARIIGELHDDYPEIRFHIYSGNAEDVTERLDKGMLDFGILIQPVNIAKYDYLNLPAKDVWGVVMRRDSPLAEKKSITREDQDNIVATYNLIYNAALLVEEGVGYAISLDKLVNVTGRHNLCFRPFEPRLESGLNIVWKKYQVFSAAAELFLEKLREKFAETGE